LSRKDIDIALKEACIEFRDDPYGFVMFMFPWGSGALEGWDGPDWWHKEQYAEIAAYCKGDGALPLRMATATGHGTGKTFFAATVIYWFMSTRANPQVVVTSNTEAQLGKTWRELSKWHQMALNREWFEWTATSFYYKANPSTWNAKAVPWSSTNTNAFAGTHEQDTLMLFDEASEIIDPVWEVADGALTTPYAMFLCFGNPTRNSGRFYQAFKDDRYKKYWKTWQIDSRKCQASTKHGTAYLEQLLEQYGGADDDRAKTRVLGQFPERASGKIISMLAVEKAMKTEVEGWDYAPKVMGVDIARYGDNQSEICLRQGRKVFPIIRVPKGDLMMQAHFIGQEIKRLKPNQTCVDGAGLGAGVVDRLRQLNFQVMDVNGGNSALNPEYLNKRAEMWFAMKEWVETGECELPVDDVLKKHLTIVGYSHTDKGRIRIERKEDIVKEFGLSPDRADALSLTFAYPLSDMMEEEDVDPVCYEDA
jgi:hypothetical protein